MSPLLKENSSNCAAQVGAGTGGKVPKFSISRKDTGV